MADTKDIEIKQGKTFSLTIRAGTDPIIRKAITGVSFASGAPRITVVGHGLTNGWPGYVTRVKGPTQLNAANNPPKSHSDESKSDWHSCAFIDADTVEFNGLTPVDERGNEWPEYISGGFLEFNTPIDLDGKTARMNIRAKADKSSTLLASSNAADAPLDVLTLIVNNTTKTITLSIVATATDDFTWKTGYYEIELVGQTPDDVLELASGKVSVTKEVTV